MKKILIFCMLCCGVTVFAQSDHWILHSVREGDKMIHTNVENTDFYISIKEKKFSGNVGCNTFKGKLQFSQGDQIENIKLVNTKAKCPESLTQLEYAVLEAVNLSDRLVFKNDTARFYNNSRVVIELVKPY